MSIALGKPITNQILSDEQIKQVNDYALRMMEEIGCRVQSEEALDIFVSVLGAVSGNLALTGMTTGGIYLGGGIPPKILSKLDEAAFMQAFMNKGRFKGFLGKIPVRVILNDKAALLGAACCAFQTQI